MTAKALIRRELDPIEFVLAEMLGMSLGEVRALPNREIEEWRGFLMFRAQTQELEARKAEARRGR